MKKYLKRPNLLNFSKSIVYLDREKDEIRIYRIMQEIVDRPTRISRQWLRKNRFVAVPCPESMGEEEIIRLTKSIAQKQLQPMFGCCTEVGDDSLFRTYTAEFVNLDPKAMLDYGVVFGPWNWVIFSESCQLAVVQAELGWHVIAGAQGLVESILDMPISEAEAEFHRHALYYENNYTEGFFQYLAQQLVDTHRYYQVANDSNFEMVD